MHNKPWTVQDFTTLRKLQAAGHTDADIAAILERTTRAVSGKRAILGIHPSRWSIAEDQILYNNPSKGGSEMIDLLPNRNAAAINARRIKLGLRINLAWTEKDKQTLHCNLHLTDNELGTMLNRSRSNVCERRRLLGLRKQTRKLWSDNEIEFLRRNYRVVSPQVIGVLLLRTEASVRNMLQRIKDL